MDDAHEERSQGVKEAEASERGAQPIRRGEAVGVMLLRGRMRMPVKMQMVFVLMKVGVRSRDARMAG